MHPKLTRSSCLMRVGAGWANAAVSNRVTAPTLLKEHRNTQAHMCDVLTDLVGTRIKQARSMAGGNMS